MESRALMPAPVLALALSILALPALSAVQAQDSLLNALLADTLSKGKGRPAAFAALGQYHEAAADYPKACVYYKRAFRLSKDPLHKLKWAQCEINRAGYAKAETLLVALSADSLPTFHAATYLLGNLFYKQDDFRKALDAYSKAARSPDSFWAQCPALAGMCLSAVKLGLADSAREMGALLLAKCPECPEVKQVAAALKRVKTVEQPAKRAPEPAADTVRRQQAPADADVAAPRYTIQFGSFGTLANARAMVKRLSAMLDTVHIVPVQVGDMTYYRVRSGSFGTREEAEQYAERRISKPDVAFRVVRE